ncbi:MAG: hypothetical protein H0T65_20670 [Deltaproteobacteria bacterium]|nr:hypothetical protein [Deltaproteobacteria bacterium]
MFTTIANQNLSVGTGGADNNQPATPSPQITRKDVASTAWAATSRTLNPRGFLTAGPQAYRQYNDPRIKDAGTGTRLLNAGLGMFGIDPLK